MHVLFEEEGTFKTGTIINDADTSLQIASASGKRSKVKASNVLLRYNEPGPSELLKEAEILSATMDVPFLWECAPDHEFTFSELAADYFGHPPSSTEASALLLSLFAAPVYFHRKGKGHFRKAPPEILAAALAGIEKKRQQAMAIERMVEQLGVAQLPTEFTPNIVTQLLYKPDRNRPECKALEAACAALGQSAAEVLLNCGALASPYAYHYQHFLFEHFPQGIDFPDSVVQETEQEKSQEAVQKMLTDWPLATAQAFSIDDISTTEIDDAFSLTPLPDGAGWRVGVHIAAPGLHIRPDTALGEIARTRLSTIYMPGDKITMLPSAAIMPFTLQEGAEHPVLSLYLTVSPDWEITAHESCIERIFIAANLRLHALEPLFEEASEVTDTDAYWPILQTLLCFAKACEQRRGNASAKQGNFDYNFAVSGDFDDAENCTITINQRPRGGPLDTLVAELMILANSIWGQLLAEHKIPAIYRVQHQGKVRMSTTAQPHEGLGVTQYAWMTAPLRRFVDLLNQWQLIACLKEEAPPFSARADALFAALRDFELTYAAYGEFQRRMESFWSLVYLQQQKTSYIEAIVLRDTLCRLAHLPLIQRFASLPELPRGQGVRLTIERIDLINLQIHARYLEVLDAPTDVLTVSEEEDELDS